MNLGTFGAYFTQSIATVVMLLLWPLLKRMAKRLVKKYGEMAHKSKSRIRQMRLVISIILNITFLFLIAVIWGVKPANLLLGLSSVLAVVGVAMFAQWSLLSNITAGIVMFFSAPYYVGDKIKIIDKDMPISASIEMIGTFYTHLRTEEGELIVIPNNLFLQKMVAIKKKSNQVESDKAHIIKHDT